MECLTWFLNYYKFIWRSGVQSILELPSVKRNEQLGYLYHPNWFLHIVVFPDGWKGCFPEPLGWRIDIDYYPNLHSNSSEFWQNFGLSELWAIRNWIWITFIWICVAQIESEFLNLIKSFQNWIWKFFTCSKTKQPFK